MSHFNLAVLHRDPDGANIDELLAPFDEATHNPEYLTFNESDDGELDEATGKRGYFRNENARYDCYERGGRFRGYLKLKPGATGRYAEPSKDPDKPDDPTHCDIARVGDVDFSPSEGAYKFALLEWDHFVEGKPWADKECEPPFNFYRPEYYRMIYGDKETYARWSSEFSTYAYMTADGEWMEPGRMGWFCVSDGTHDSNAAYRKGFKRDIVNADPDLYITILDCHI